MRRIFNHLNSEREISLGSLLNAVAIYNPRLKIICYNDQEDISTSGTKAIWEILVRVARNDNDKLRELNKQTKYVPKGDTETIGKLIEQGYTEIKPSKLN